MAQPILFGIVWVLYARSVDWDPTPNSNDVRLLLRINLEVRERGGVEGGERRGANGKFTVRLVGSPKGERRCSSGCWLLDGLDTLGLGVSPPTASVWSVSMLAGGWRMGTLLLKAGLISSLW